MKKPVPEHVAIIMDGNGRWAKARGKPRVFGHEAGVEALRRTVRAAGKLGIKWLTVYAFSSENWSRPQAEVRDLMSLLKYFIRRDLKELHKQGVRIHIVGERQSLKPDIRALLEEAETLTADNRHMNVVVAFNYGSRDEITRAALRVAQDLDDGRIERDSISPETFSTYLDTAHMPDPDLIIRTGGDQRLSNFLLWQAAYAEFIFLDCHWPEFDGARLASAIQEFQNRERRFGGLNEDDMPVQEVAS